MNSNMRQERIKLGWPQEFVAQRIGVTPETIHHIETGKRKPSFNVLVKLEDLFGMDYRELFNLPERQLREKMKKPDGNRACLHQNNSIQK